MLQGTGPAFGVAFFPAGDLLFQMKTGPFAEHSNQLWNISAVPSWSKVNQGLIRMYKAEVRDLLPPPATMLFLVLGTKQVGPRLLRPPHFSALTLSSGLVKPGTSESPI